MLIHSRKKYAYKPTPEHTNYSYKKGIYVPSVTTVLGVISKETLVYWANQLGFKHKTVTKELDMASEIGTLVHEYVESILMGEEPDTTEIDNVRDLVIEDQINNCIQSFNQWQMTDEYKDLEVLNTELPIVTRDFGGTIDIVARYKGQNVLIDLKTTGDFYSTQYMQLAAYAKGYEDNYGIHIDRIAVLRMDKKKGKIAKLRFLDEIQGGDIDYYYLIFRKALDLFLLTDMVEKDWN